MEEQSTDGNKNAKKKKKFGFKPVPSLTEEEKKGVLRNAFKSRAQVGIIYIMMYIYIIYFLSFVSFLILPIGWL
jgi:hypothetical protein